MAEIGCWQARSAIFYVEWVAKAKPIVAPDGEMMGVAALHPSCAGNPMRCGSGLGAVGRDNVTGSPEALQVINLATHQALEHISH